MTSLHRNCPYDRIYMFKLCVSAALDVWMDRSIDKEDYLWVIIHYYYESVCICMSCSIDLVCRNVIHGSDSVESAAREISLWFEDHELFCYEECSQHWIYA